MRTILVLIVLALLVPAAAFSRGPAPENGTLSVREGRGMVQLSAKGSITGRVRGKATITDPNPYDSNRPVVYGATKTTYRNAKTTVYQGKNVRFRLLGALYKVKLDGRAIFLSAVAHGQGTVDGAGDPAANIFYDGTMSLNDEPYHSLPNDPTPIVVEAPAS
jgi:hypothetical protein